MILLDSGAPLARAFAQTLTSLIVHIIVLQKDSFSVQTAINTGLLLPVPFISCRIFSQ